MNPIEAAPCPRIICTQPATCSGGAAQGTLANFPLLIQIACKKELLKHGADVNARDGDHASALQAASLDGDVDADSKLLLMHGAGRE